MNKRIYVSIFLALVTLLMVAGNGQGLSERTAGISSDSIASGTDDGPHVFWQDDRTVRVIYCCNDEIISRVFDAMDTLRFHGFCRDTVTEYIIVAETPRPEPDQVDHVERILAVSDTHGDFKSFVAILTAAGVIDGDLRWTWGSGRLVILGDVFDRGPAVTECLWLIYRLERESSAAGGAVHFILGNHELMVLRGDLRYVNERYSRGIAGKSRFAYDELFGAETELGRWLRTKNTLVRLNRTLFVHGGLTVNSLQSAGGIGDINSLVRMGLDYSTLRLHFEEKVKNLYGSLGPLWYRGYTQGIEGSYPPANTAQVDSVLRLCDVDKVVVGHTEQDTISLFHDGKVIAIDVDVEALGGQQALLWQNGQFSRITDDGDRQAIPGQ